MTPWAFFAHNGLKSIGTREAKGKWLVQVGVFWCATVDGQERWVTEVDDDARFPGSAAGALKRGQNKRKLQRIDFEQTACSPQRTLLFKKRVDDVSLSQGRAVIFVGRLGLSRFHAPDRPTKLQKIRVRDRDTRRGVVATLECSNRKSREGGVKRRWDGQNAEAGR